MICLDSKFAEVYQNLGSVYLKMKNDPLAVENVKKALEVKPLFMKAQAGLEKAEALPQQL